MKKFQSLIVIVIFGTATMLIYNGCKKEKPAPAETCYDGIQNQNETGVDCGGKCDPCPSLLCDGNGTTSYMPLTLNNVWTYKLPGGVSWDRTITADSMVTFGSNTYFRLEAYEQSSGYAYTYFRTDGAGNVYEYKVSEGAEYMAVPASPTNGQVCATYSGTYTVASLKVVVANVQVGTSACTYNGCVQMGEYDGSGILQGSFYYKKGLGLVRISYVTFTDLKAVTLN